MDYQCASLIISAISSIASVVAIYVALRVNYTASLPQPVVFLHHDRDGSSISLVVKNLGSGVATDIRIENFDYSMISKELVPKVRKSFVAHGIPLLVPGAQRDTVISIGNGDMLRCADKICVVQLEYKERTMFNNLRERTVPFTLDISSFAGSLYTLSDSHEAVESLRQIAKHSEKLLSCQKAISKSLQSISEKNDEANSTL